jgi:hypothetical protein
MTQKRLSHDSVSISKRPKQSLDENQVVMYQEIDSIPFRTTARKDRSEGINSAATSFSTSTVSSYNRQSFGSATPFSSSAATSNNTSFTSVGYINLEDSDTDYFTSQELPSESDNEFELDERLKNIWRKDNALNLYCHFR